MPRLIQDAALKVTKALPAAAATANSDSIDLGQSTADTINESFSVKLSAPAVANLADTKTITYTFQDSADNSSFSAIPELATLVQTGAGGVGASATTRTVRLPATARRYIRVSAAVASAGGDNTASSLTLQLLF